MLITQMLESRVIGIINIFDGIKYIYIYIYIYIYVYVYMIKCYTFINQIFNADIFKKWIIIY